ncbi:MAG: DUF3443 domain-containing protein [Gammaproteobacteria bacterium]|nr:DUF3443 domain-containing protein [Gammaproteobacteria bacterium]MBU1415949.1 DUF3443 domain-containing protein [Gammaproteobacteria bacterium]
MAGRYLAGALALVLAIAGCGGGGGGGDSAATNELTVTVGSGPTSAATNVNIPYVSVTICRPGSSVCQTIDHVLLDTASTGFRVLASVLDSRLADLPRQQTSGGDDMAACAAFITGYTWGAVRLADVKLSAMKATSLPIQIIADPAVGVVPSSCANRGADAITTPQDMFANGILGVGWFTEDCGQACALAAIPGWYYGCPSGTCSSAVASLARQVRNPVAAFDSDNNGVIVEMNAVPASGARTVSGKLYLGIGTRTNNALGSPQVFDLDASGELQTEYGGSTLTAFVDTGSNALYFPDGSITTCDSASHAPGFYCPMSTLSLSATMRGATNGTQAAVDFEIASAESLVVANPGNLAYDNIGAPLGAFFDWGMPFFYGRRVSIAIEGRSTPGGDGPYIAY